MSSEDSSAKAPKWICEYCTYENYPSAIKCTMCKGLKPLLNEDIFRLSPPQTAFDGEEEHGAVADVVEPSNFDSYYKTSDCGTTTTTSSSATSSALVGSAKWACKICTYLNWPRSTRCTQCCTRRGANSYDISKLTDINLVQSSCNSDDQQHKFSINNINNKLIDSNERNLNLLSTLAAARCGSVEVASQDCVDKGTPTKMHNQIPTTTTIITSSTSTTNTAAATTAVRIHNGLKSMRLICGSDSELNACNILDSKKFLEQQNSNNIAGASVIAATPNRHQLVSQERQHHGSGSGDSSISSSSNNMRTATYTSSSASITTHLNNITNTAPMSGNNQLQQQQQQSCATTSPQQPGWLPTKWSCNACTYKNWPKSLKCSMCGEPREHNAMASSSLSSCGSSIHNIGSSSSSSSSSGGGGGCSDSNSNASNINNISNNKQISEIENSESNQHDTTVSANNSFNKKNIYQLGSSETINCDTVQERQERRQRQIRRQVDWQWLNACLGVVENNYSAVEAYLSCGGNPARSLTSTEIAALNRNSAFDVGHTLIHLAIRFHREEMLPMLLAQISGSGPGIKRVPSYVAPDLASDIRRHFANTLRMRKSALQCHYVQEHATFSLPSEIEELPSEIQEQLYDELLDRDAQKQLEMPPPALNWSLEITSRLGSRLFVLWNRSAGDCLLDSAMQATWGVFDRDNVLRRALSDTLHQCGHIFYPRWKEYEMLQASMLQFTLEEAQWQDDWATLLTLASQPGSSLEQLHIFALAHILRRPIIVYGVKYVKSFRGEDIGYARFEGLYLPLFWDQNFCIKSPITLGYTRGHFSALVPMEPYVRRDECEDVTYLPLMDCESKLLPIHFLSQSEVGREEAIMRQWLDVCVTEGGLLVALQKFRKRPLLVAQMLEEWLNHYRRIAQVITAPYVRRPQQTGYSSDGDSDEE